MNKIIVGLTGGICSGKSRVCEELKILGCEIIDADEISRAVTASGTECGKALAENFPEAAADGVIDRRRLRELVFNDSGKLARLNELTHPLIAERMKKEIERSSAETVVLAVPLLFETGLGIPADVTVTVSCDEETRIQRLVKRDNIGRELAVKIIRSQMTDAEREMRADIIIRNDGNEEELAARVRQVFEFISGRAEKNKNSE